MPIEKLGSSLLVSSVFLGERNCTAAYQDRNSEARLKKKAHVILFTHERA